MAFESLCCLASSKACSKPCVTSSRDGSTEASKAFCIFETHASTAGLAKYFLARASAPLELKPALMAAALPLLSTRYSSTQRNCAFESAFDDSAMVSVPEV